MGKGYTGRILRVDLTVGAMEVETRDDAFYRTYLGGRGIGYYYLLKEVPAGIDPFSPHNLLIFATGVMTGAPIAASCRFAVVGKSPLTGAVGESESAGFFGPELKKAGFDAIVFKGRAEKPVYLYVTDGSAELKDASHLVREGAREVEEAICREVGQRHVRVAQTGLAGMNRVLYANITNNLTNFNGRNGFGALMGSKNLRAVAAKGKARLCFHQPGILRQTARDYADTFKKHPAGKTLNKYGTTIFAQLLSEAGALPVNNFRRSRAEDIAPLKGDTYNRTLLAKRRGCYACPIKCKRGVALDHPRYGIDSRYGGPEYETMAALGSNLNIFDLKAIAKGNEICNRYCMDTISAGMTLAFAFECFEKGIITPVQTGGLRLEFGNPELMLRLLEMTAHREGFGDQLAQGSSRLARKWGVVDESANLSVKGQELPMHDPRVKVGVGIGFAVNPGGPNHMNAAHDTLFTDKESFSFRSAQPLGIETTLPATELSDRKVDYYLRLDYYWTALDALGLCVFGFAPRGVMPIEKMVECLNAVTGWDVSLEEILEAARRTTMMARAFNSREGFNPEDDYLPKRLYDPKPDGPQAGKAIFSAADFEKAVKAYYAKTGCDPASGRPRRETLAALGLDWVEEMLDRKA